MKKQFLIPACILLFAAVVFIDFSMGHPEMSFPWSLEVTHILYGIYVDVVLLLFILAFWKKTDRAYVLAIILELGAVFFLMQSILTVLPKGESNWFLPFALGLNCIALLLNSSTRKKQQKAKE